MIRQGLNIAPKNKNIIVCKRCGHPLWVFKELGNGLFLWCPKCRRKFDRVKKIEEVEKP
jgi:uncharacterized protein YbaR (Trm112 family)